jgi:hypothetical protein
MVEQAFSWLVLALFSVGFLVYLCSLVTGRSLGDEVEDAPPSVIRLRSLLWLSVCLWLAAKSADRLLPADPDAVLSDVLLGVVVVAWAGITVGVVAWVRQRMAAARE